MNRDLPTPPGRARTAFAAVRRSALRPGVVTVNEWPGFASKQVSKIVRPAPCRQQQERRPSCPIEETPAQSDVTFGVQRELVRLFARAAFVQSAGETGSLIVLLTKRKRDRQDANEPNAQATLHARNWAGASIWRSQRRRLHSSCERAGGRADVSWTHGIQSSASGRRSPDRALVFAGTRRVC